MIMIDAKWNKTENFKLSWKIYWRKGCWTFQSLMLHPFFMDNAQMSEEHPLKGSNQKGRGRGSDAREQNTCLEEAEREMESYTKKKCICAFLFYWPSSLLEGVPEQAASLGKAGKSVFKPTSSNDGERGFKMAKCILRDRVILLLKNVETLLFLK